MLVGIKQVADCIMQCIKAIETITIIIRLYRQRDKKCCIFWFSKISFVKETIASHYVIYYCISMGELVRFLIEDKGMRVNIKNVLGKRCKK